MAEQKTILIFGAMDVETELLISSLGESKETVIGGYPFYEGFIDGKKIVVCRTYTGMENSAAATAIGIMTFKPDFIISQGTAGGHNPKLHKKDIVIGRRLINISSFQTRRYGAGEGMHPENWSLKNWDLFEDSLQDPEVPALFSDEELVNLALSSDYKEGQLHSGTISSSNNWNQELDRINLLVEKIDSDCEEMESFAATQIALRFKVPSITIRIISNSEQHPGEEYERTTAVSCQRFVLDFISRV